MRASSDSSDSSLLYGADLVDVASGVDGIVCDRRGGGLVDIHLKPAMRDLQLWKRAPWWSYVKGSPSVSATGASKPPPDIREAKQNGKQNDSNPGVEGNEPSSFVAASFNGRLTGLPRELSRVSSTSITSLGTLGSSFDMLCSMSRFR